MVDVKKFENTLDQMVQLLMNMKDSLTEDENKTETETETETETPQVAAQSIQQPPSSEEYANFDQLKTALQSDKWPESVNPNLICDPNSEDDKKERGRGIIELMIEEDLKELKFLDVGCGEGHCAALSKDYGTDLSVGFDIQSYDYWESLKEKDGLVMTTNFEEVKSNGPYDVIVLFDVIDHLKGMSATDLFRHLKSVLSDNGKIYLRCHPFTSRHATHLYHELNKAYIHLVFTDEELAQLIPNSKHEEKSAGITHPLKTYQSFIDNAGLKVANRRDITEKVEPFFKIPKISERIIKNTKMNSYPEFQMSLQFIDYVLRK